MDKKELVEKIFDSSTANSRAGSEIIARNLLNFYDITPKAEKLFMGPDRRNGGDRRVKDRRIGHDPSYSGRWRRNIGSNGRRSGKDRRQEQAEKQTPCPWSSELCCTYESQIKEIKKELEGEKVKVKEHKRASKHWQDRAGGLMDKLLEL